MLSLVFSWLSGAVFLTSAYLFIHGDYFQGGINLLLSIYAIVRAIETRKEQVL
jgi:hypothetical protein